MTPVPGSALLALLRCALLARIDARCDAALADRSLAEHARRSLGQRARHIAREFNVTTEKKAHVRIV